jgi:hypothetical protein
MSNFEKKKKRKKKLQRKKKLKNWWKPKSFLLRPIHCRASIQQLTIFLYPICWNIMSPIFCQKKTIKIVGKDLNSLFCRLFKVLKNGQRSYLYLLPKFHKSLLLLRKCILKKQKFSKVDLKRF